MEIPQMAPGKAREVAAVIVDAAIRVYCPQYE